MRYRNKIIVLIFFVCLSFLTVRIFYFQVLAGSKLSKAASTQRKMNFDIEKTRGNILDRNGISFTNRTKRVTIVFKPLILREKEEELRKVCNILFLDFIKTRREMDIKKEPVFFECDEETGKRIAGLKFAGVSVVNSLRRYDGGSIARHIIGYLNVVDQVGETGIEKFFEDVLKYEKESSIEIIADAKNNPLQGLGYRLIKPGKKDEIKNIKLTLDWHIQKIVENVMDENHLSGAVVVEDVNTGDIAAMASKPDFDQTRVDKYLNSSQKELFNKAVASYNVGSIFKIIDTAQALEDDVNIGNSLFCPGYIKIGDKILRCTSYSKGGHGWVDLTKAFTLSCNPYFIDLGIRIGHKNILEMAGKFGFGAVTGIKHQGVNESAGNLPDAGRYFTDGDTANMSIGQGEVMATPLQVADLVATVANGGIKNKINIADSIVDGEGAIVKELKQKEGKRIISKKTSDTIKSLMEEVVHSGTGKKANLDKYGGAAGKTGSAETGQSVNNKMVVQAWFAGYFPLKEPKYSIAVFVENGEMGGEAAAPIFRKIAEQIMIDGL